MEGATLYIMKDGLIDQTGPLWRYVIEVGCTPIPAVGPPRRHPTPFVTNYQKEGA